MPKLPPSTGLQAYCYACDQHMPMRHVELAYPELELDEFGAPAQYRGYDHYCGGCGTAKPSGVALRRG